MASNDFRARCVTFNGNQEHFETGRCWSSRRRFERPRSQPDRGDICIGLDHRRRFATVNTPRCPDLSIDNVQLLDVSNRTAVQTTSQARRQLLTARILSQQNGLCADFDTRRMDGSQTGFRLILGDLPVFDLDDSIRMSGRFLSKIVGRSCGQHNVGHCELPGQSFGSSQESLGRTIKFGPRKKT